MQKRRFPRNSVPIAFRVLLLLPSFLPGDTIPLCGVGPGNTAVTCGFLRDGAGLPTEARTDFLGSVWDAPLGADALDTAEHELFHALGFSVFYPRFAADVIATPGAGANGIPAGLRAFSTNGMVAGILMVLTPATTHADPNATGAAPWPATGYNQANEIMQPNLHIGDRLNATDAAVLNAAFGWSATGVDITVNFLTPDYFSAEDTAILLQAAAAAEALFGGVQNNSPDFIWDVSETPEPATIALVVIGMCLVALRVRAAPKSYRI